MARAQSSAARKTKPDKKVLLGYRYQKYRRADGREDVRMVPLRDRDLLYPHEDDFVVHNDLHIADVFYVYGVLRIQTRNRYGLRNFADHIINFQHGDVQPMGPDEILVKGEPFEWDRGRGTFPVKDMKTEVVFVIEITSPTTRNKDFGPKFELYFRAGVPLYILIDPPYGGSKKPRGVLPYRAGAESYELLPLDENGRFPLDPLDISIGIADGRVVCFDANGKRIGDTEALHDSLITAEASAEAEKARADAEKARAEAAEARIRELEAQIAKPKRRKK